eukprot:5963260-Amphidinium_carterae.1
MSIQAAADTVAQYDDLQEEQNNFSGNAAADMEVAPQATSLHIHPDLVPMWLSCDNPAVYDLALSSPTATKLPQLILRPFREGIHIPTVRLASVPPGRTVHRPTKSMLQLLNVAVHTRFPFGSFPCALDSIGEIVTRALGKCFLGIFHKMELDVTLPSEQIQRGKALCLKYDVAWLGEGSLGCYCVEFKVECQDTIHFPVEPQCKSRSDCGLEVHSKAIAGRMLALVCHSMMQPFNNSNKPKSTQTIRTNPEDV